jgi:hypothetical protein
VAFNVFPELEDSIASKHAWIPDMDKFNLKSNTWSKVELRLAFMRRQSP